MNNLVKKLKFSLFCALIFLTSCGGNSCEFEFTDFSNNPMFECTPIDGSGTYSFGIRLKGEVSHPIELLVYQEKVKPRSILKYNFIGKIDTLIYNDWGRAKLVGVIKPNSNTIGRLKVKCSF